jgi:GDPmannose 4,6-dehydratase
MNAIIFGAFGQDGYYLSELLLSKGINVIKIGRFKDHGDIDITDLKSIKELIKSLKPTFIFHLAANSTTRHDVIFENHNVICDGTLNILESVRIYSPETKVFISGSGLQFVNTGQPIKETDAFEARDPYSVSRIQSVYASRYFRNLGLKVFVGYLFNHDSPLRSERHMAKKISAFANRIANGSNELLEIGDISVIKEWGFAGDIVDGIFTLVNQNEIFEANIGTGKGYSIEDWLNICFELIGFDWKKNVIFKYDFKPDYNVLVSNTNLINQIGWNAKLDINGLGKLMIETNNLCN